MNIVICGAGEVGRHAAEVLGGEGHNVTIIDRDTGKLASLEEVLDIRSMVGNGTHADDLAEAGCAKADVFIAATNDDVTNLVSASVASGIGAHRTIARVHHSAYLDRKAFDYQMHFGIDHMVCPESATAAAITQSLRSPGALAVERFAKGQIEIQQLTVSSDAPVIGHPLSQLSMPKHTRIAAVESEGVARIPDGATVIHAGDIVTLIGDVDVFKKAAKLIHTEAAGHTRVMLMGGTSMTVWLARAMRSPAFSCRIVEKNRARAEELAEKLDWATVLCADPDDPDVFEQERVSRIDAFIAVTADDEHNILLAARAKSLGADNTIAVLQRPTYLHLLSHVGIDRAFSPRVTAVNQIVQMLSDSPVRHMASLAVGIADVYEVTVPAKANGGVVGRPLRDVSFPSRSIIAAIQRGDETHLPGGNDSIEPGDTVVVIGPSGFEKALRKAFGVK